MAESKIWIHCCTIDHEIRTVGPTISLEVSLDSTVSMLTTKVRQDGPSRLRNAPLGDLTLWKWSGGMRVLQHRLPAKEDFEAKGVFGPCLGAASFRNLQWTSEDVFVVQLPHATNEDHYERSMPNINEWHQEVVISVDTKGSFTQDDLALNFTLHSDVDDDPLWLGEFKKLLKQKRGLPEEAFPSSQKATVDFLSPPEKAAINRTFESYFDNETRKEGNVEVNVIEKSHILFLLHCWSFSQGSSGDAKRLFKEHDVSSTFFAPVAYYMKRTVGAGVECRQSDQPWPFRLFLHVVQGEQKGYYTYNPKSDFLVLKDGLPRLLVEVNSYKPGTPPADRHRALLQGACMTRFANAHLDNYRTKKDFRLIVIYIDENGAAERNILFQKEGDARVHFTSDTFDLVKSADSRLAFVREFYNFASFLQKDPPGDTRDQMAKLQRDVNVVRLKYELASMSFSKRRVNDVGGGEDKPSKKAKNDRGGNDALESHGYEAIPETFEDEKGGLYEPLKKLPANICIVYQMSDVTKTKLIAKQSCKRSHTNESEVEILRYLAMNTPPSPHIIRLIDSFMVVNQMWLIFPKLYTISDELFNGGKSLRGKVEQLCWGLIKGVAHLHENGIAHLDIKPDNLVYDNAYELKIMDFDIAVRVKGEEEEVEGYRGTRGWTAPEVGDADGPERRYSAIRADRWSSGRVLLLLLKIEEGNRVLRTLAERLTLNNPRERPPLLEWPKWVNAATTELDVSRTHTSSRTTRRPREDVENDGNVRIPVKKSRLHY